MPKTGSATAVAPVGSNGTRCCQSRIVSQCPAIEPATPSAMRTATTDDDRAARAGSGPACRPGVTSIGVAAPARRGRSHGSHGAPRGAAVGVRRGLVEPVDQRRSVPPSPRRGRQRAGRRARGCRAGRAGRRRRRAANSPTWTPSRGPEDRVEADAREPDRVGPELDPDDEHQDDEDRRTTTIADRRVQDAGAAVARAADRPRPRRHRRGAAAAGRGRPVRRSAGPASSDRAAARPPSVVVRRRPSAAVGVVAGAVVVVGSSSGPSSPVVVAIGVAGPVVAAASA